MFTERIIGVNLPNLWLFFGGVIHSAFGDPGETRQPGAPAISFYTSCRDGMNNSSENSLRNTRNDAKGERMAMNTGY